MLEAKFAEADWAAALSESMKNGLREGEAIGIQKGEAIGIQIGKAEAIILLLEDLGEVPKDVREHILQMSDLEVLKLLLRKASKAESIQEFCEEMEQIVTR